MKIHKNSKRSYSDLLNKCSSHISQLTPADEEAIKPYTWAVILGGTNDLGWGHGADEMYEHIQKVWDIPLSHGTKVLALTVPECGAKPMCSQELTDRRDAFNNYILGHEQENL